MPRHDYVIDVDELLSCFDDPALRIVDGTWLLDKTRTPKTEFIDEHISGAVFFDLDAIADHSTDLPHMLPDPAAFAEAVGELGISEQHDIVVYDTNGTFSAARVWWTFRIMGAKSVRVLSGGLPAWKQAGGPTASAPPNPAKALFRTSFNKSEVVNLVQMRGFVSTKRGKVLDARPQDRFLGQAPEPRPHLKSGHMPGALNIPTSRIVKDGHLLSDEELKLAFASFDLDVDELIVTTCGSGVTAAVTFLALKTLGYDNLKLYDGSWAEWAGEPDTPITP